jgi:NAD(P)-dependent dehydrogenase (short-subunit alcohol dehydrogenase family)
VRAPTPALPQEGEGVIQGDKNEHSISEGPLSLKDKTAVVTGAGAGIGQAIAQLIAQAGAKVVVADINADAAVSVAHAIREAGGKAVAAVADVSQDVQVAAMLDRALGEFRQPRRAGQQRGHLPQEAVPGSGRRLLGQVARREPARHVPVPARGDPPHAGQGTGGAIVNISSVSSMQAVVYHNATYNASKAGVNSLTKTTALEFAADGIRVNAVLPGGVLTPGRRPPAATSNSRARSWAGPHPAGQDGRPRRHRDGGAVFREPGLSADHRPAARGGRRLSSQLEPGGPVMGPAHRMNQSLGTLLASAVRDRPATRCISTWSAASHHDDRRTGRCWRRAWRGACCTRLAPWRCLRGPAAHRARGPRRCTSRRSEIGAVLVPIVHIYGPAEVGFILRQSRARFLAVPYRWRGIDFLERVEAVGALPDLERVIVMG